MNPKTGDAAQETLWKMPHLFLPSNTIRDEPAVRFLSEQGISYRERIVNEADPELDAQGEPIPAEVRVDALPAIDWDGTIVNDLTLERLIPLLRDRGIQFEDS
jgi:hypothetical protein